MGVVLEVILLTLLIGAVLTGDRLATNARSMPYGPLRTVAVVAATPAAWLNHLLFIDRARDGLRSLANRGGKGARLSKGPRPSGAASETATATPSPREPSFRNPSPTAESPLTVIIAGDSMTEAFGKYLKSSLTKTGVVVAVHDFRYSSGIARPDFFDWPKHLRQSMAEQDPDVVMMMVGANDGQDIKVDGKFMAFGSPDWTQVYSARVGDAMDIMAVDGRRVYWIGLPVARPPKYSAKMKTLDAVYKAEAEKRDGVVYVDTWTLFSDSKGAYSAYLKDSSGKSVLMRRDDGIHFTVAGANRLTTYVMGVIGKDYDLAPGQ